MKQQPFYIGQEVVALKSVTNALGQRIIKDHIYTVVAIKSCKCGRCYVDINIPKGAIKYRNPCGNCSKPIHNVESFVWAGLLAPIERTRTKYVVKEVEVAPAVRELENCNQ